MAAFIKKTFCFSDDLRDVEEALSIKVVEDEDAINLSHVGQAAYECLRKTHGRHHNKCWDVSSGKVIGEIHQTPRISEPVTKLNHSDWFPEKMCEIMSKTQYWCDVLSLVPPDGSFLTMFKRALHNIDARARQVDKKGKPKEPVVIRILFGNLIGMPVNCDAVIKKLTEDLAVDCNIRLWVGAWRRRLSWNHAKIIAVDGRYLHTGGHNLMDKHYLCYNPVHDLSLEMEGEVTDNAHTFAQFHWDFIKSKQSTCCGQIAEKIPDNMPLAWKTRVIVSEFPEGLAAEFPPHYYSKCVPNYDKLEGVYPIIGIGRLGAITKIVNRLLRKDRPADDAFLAMFNSARRSIKIVCQDFGPCCFPGTRIPLPGLIWPKIYLTALARAIWERNVSVEIILCNPGSLPANCGITEAAYGNGWNCVDVAAEIVKRIQKHCQGVGHRSLRTKVTRNLHVCYIRRDNKRTYEDGANIGLHSKHFIVDDTCFYIGSQNLYFCDLAEWGVIIDNESKTRDILNEYWIPLWDSSFHPADCDVGIVMDNLSVSRESTLRDQENCRRTINMTNTSLARIQRGNFTLDSDFFNKE